jgi:hypothetical protein
VFAQRQFKSEVPREMLLQEICQRTACFCWTNAGRARERQVTLLERILQKQFSRQKLDEELPQLEAGDAGGTTCVSSCRTEQLGREEVTTKPDLAAILEKPLSGLKLLGALHLNML